MRKKFGILNNFDKDFSLLSVLVILPSGKEYNHLWNEDLKEDFEPKWIKDFSLFYSPKKNKRTFLHEKSIKKSRANYAESNCWN